jgi:hypothetical protein
MEKVQKNSVNHEIMCFEGATFSQRICGVYLAVIYAGFMVDKVAVKQVL